MEQQNKKQVLLKIEKDMHEDMKKLSSHTGITMQDILTQFIYEKIYDYKIYLMYIEQYQPYAKYVRGELKWIVEVIL